MHVFYCHELVCLMEQNKEARTLLAGLAGHERGKFGTKEDSKFKWMEDVSSGSKTTIPHLNCQSNFFFSSSFPCHSFTMLIFHLLLPVNKVYNKLKKNSEKPHHDVWSISHVQNKPQPPGLASAMRTQPHCQRTGSSEALVKIKNCLLPTQQLRHSIKESLNG